MQNKTIIFGAPGCGKTHYLLNLLEKLLVDYAPHEIAFVSFTRKGAYEGRDRAVAQFGYKPDEFPFFRTLHSIAFKNGEFDRQDVISKKHYKLFSDAMDMKFTGYYTEDFNGNDDKYLFYYFLKRNNPKQAALIEDTLDIRKMRFVENNFIRFKHQFGVIDYSDMLMFFVDRGEPLPVKVAVIDEAQDLTTLQWEMCEVAFSGCDKVYIAGDDDQAIYEWNGADVDYFLGLDGERIILDRSYRLPSNILKFSKHITHKIQTRVEKKFAPNNRGGHIYFHNTVEEVPVNLNETYYFLSRNNVYLRKYEDELRKRALPYSYKGTPSINLKLVKAIMDYEHYRKTGIYESDLAALRVDNFTNRRVDGLPAWYDKFDLTEEESNYYRDLIAAKTKLDNNNIRLDTIHGVKGGEADNVVLMLDMTRSVKQSYEKGADSELRCLYVGCTRAKKNLHIIHSQSRYGYGDYINFNSFGDVKYAGQ